MVEVITTLFAANATILFVMAAAFRFAGRGRGDQPYWHSWTIANIMLGAALVVFIFEPMLWGPIVDILPNGLLIAGFGLRWQAARQFGQRPAPAHIVWGPAILFGLICLIPSQMVNYQTAYTIVNVMLAVLAFSTAGEFWRDRGDRLPSRVALVFAYSILAVSFSVRVGQGLFDSAIFGSHLPLDLMLVVHLGIALLHSPASGAFALSLAYERGAARLKHEATHDALTGLFNRRAFEEALRVHIRNAAEQPFGVILFDIDHFKAINDRYGHAAGDDAIRACADILRTEVGNDAVVARIGGEEFAVIMKEARAQTAYLAAERVRRAVRARIVNVQDRHLTMTVSAGICHSSEGDCDFDELMRVADNGLYAAKNLGRDQVASSAA